MVSEDSQEFRWFPMVHRLNDLRNLDQSFKGQVFALLHHLDDRRKLLEIVFL